MATKSYSSSNFKQRLNYNSNSNKNLFPSSSSFQKNSGLNGKEQQEGKEVVRLVPDYKNEFEKSINFVRNFIPTGKEEKKYMKFLDDIAHRRVSVLEIDIGDLNTVKI